MVREPVQTIEVETSPAVKSKINWTQIAGLFASVAAFFGLKDLDPNQISQVILGIQAAVGLTTIIMKTFFSTTITPQSAETLKDTHA